MRDAIRRVYGNAIKKLFRSLASRIILFVFASTLVTTLVVTWVSTESIERFLRAKIDQKFPAILARAADRIDIWYSQRILDVQTFARSGTVGVNTLRLQSPRASRVKHARMELGDYLSYVLERFPQYEALFVLDATGEELLWVGSTLELGEALRSELVSIGEASVSEMFIGDDRRMQIVSAPIDTADKKRTGTLHAVLPIEVVDELLTSERLGPSGGVFLVARDGVFITPHPDHRETYQRPLPEPNARPEVIEYTNPADIRVIGSAVRLPRFSWSLLVEESYDEAFQPSIAAIREILLINLGTVLLFSAIAFWVALSIVRPIKALSFGAKRIAEGETEVVVTDNDRTDEIGFLTQAFNRMAKRLHHNRIELQESRLNIEAANVRLRGQNEELQRMNEVLEQLSITDGLTKLYNHRFFQENLTREIARVTRTKEPLTLILIDIDNFKQLNDRYGHAPGDRVLCDVARIMSGLVRETDVLARYGGEEFAILPSRADLEGAIGLAEKIRLSVSESTTRLETQNGFDQVRVTVSIGVARFSGDRMAFFNDADRALYRAKANGKDCVIAEVDEDEL